jgi:hypothetical protein
MNIRILTLIVFMLCSGCSTLDICDEDGQSYLVARFRTIEDGVEKDTTLTDLSIYGIRNGITGGMLYDSTAKKMVTLPLDPGNTVSEFVFTTAKGNDTLFIHHSSEAYLISYNCGFAARFTLETPEHRGNQMKNLEVTNETVDAETETNEEHLHIFF